MCQGANKCFKNRDWHIFDIFHIAIIVSRVVWGEGTDLRRTSGVRSEWKDKIIICMNFQSINQSIYYLLHNFNCLSPCLWPTIFLLKLFNIWYYITLNTFISLIYCIIYMHIPRECTIHTFIESPRFDHW